MPYLHILINFCLFLLAKSLLIWSVRSSTLSFWHILVWSSHCNIDCNHSTSIILLVLNIVKHNYSFQVLNSFWSDQKLVWFVSLPLSRSIEILRPFSYWLIPVLTHRTAYLGLRVLCLWGKTFEALSILSYLMKKSSLWNIIHYFKYMNSLLQFSWDCALKSLNRSLLSNMKFTFLSLNFHPDIFLFLSFRTHWAR